MESYYTPSYPDSGNSSPHSRETDFENSPPWEEHLNPQAYKVKFMCSYGGKIHPRPHDNQLSYVGGDTKIVVVDRNVKFSALLSKLSGFCDNDTVSIKYQLPGEDLDALISVTNDEDLENMLQEYDRLYKVSPRPARLRLFVFGASSSQTPPGNVTPVNRNFGSDEGVTNKSDKERFVDALNSGPIQAPPPLAAAAQPPISTDFLFGLEKEMHPPSPQHKHHQAPVLVGNPRDSIQPVDPPVHEHDVPVPLPEDKLDRSDPIQNHLLDLQRVRIGSQPQQVMYHRKSDDNPTSGFPVSSTGEYYVHQKLPEKMPQFTVPANVTVQQGGGYWTEKQVPGGVYPGTEPVYMIPTPGGGYNHPQMMRQMTGTTGQGYYTFQRMHPEAAYRDQQVQYNIVPSMSATVTQPSLPAANVTGYSDGYGVVRPMTSGGGGGGIEGAGGYTQVAYDSVTGRQVYYTTPQPPQGGVMVGGGGPQTTPQQSQYHQAISTGMSVEVKALNPEAVKVVGKVTAQGSV